MELCHINGKINYKHPPTYFDNFDVPMSIITEPII